MASRKQVQEQNPELDFASLNQKIGQLWKDLDDESRREFESKANVDRQRYEREMDAAGLKGVLKFSNCVQLNQWSSDFLMLSSILQSRSWPSTAMTRQKHRTTPMTLL
jgi:hypothetical protein